MARAWPSAARATSASSRTRSTTTSAPSRPRTGPRPRSPTPSSCSTPARSPTPSSPRSSSARSLDQAVSAAERIETLVFVFDAHAGGLFDGRLGAALERAEAGGALRIRDVLYVGRDAQTGEDMVLRASGGAGGMVTALADFRMDASRRQGATATALASQDDGETVRAIAARLEPGASVIAIAVEHSWRD